MADKYGYVLALLPALSTSKLRNKTRKIKITINIYSAMLRGKWGNVTGAKLGEREKHQGAIKWQSSGDCGVGWRRSQKLAMRATRVSMMPVTRPFFSGEAALVKW